MNLAFLARRFGRIGGTERDLFELTARLASRGHSIHVYCSEARVEPPPGVTLHAVAAFAPGRLARLLAFAVLGPRRARRGGHDLVISYERVLQQDVARCGGGTHRRFMQRMAEQGSPVTRLLRRLSPYHRLLLHIERTQFSPGHFRRAHAVSRLVKDELIEVYGVAPDAIDVIYCGVDTDIFRPENRATDGVAVRERLGVPHDARVVLFLGNGFERKGLDALLAGLARTDPSIHGLVVGTDAQMARYVALAQQLGLGDRVHFVGQQQDTHRYYAAADAFVLPSVQEAFGIVVLEAMATGLPCIVSSRAGAAEVLPPAMHAFLLRDPRDADEVAARITGVLEPEPHAQLAAACRDAALRYSLEEHTRVSEELYRALCG